jgi:hypothetical protein
MRDPQTVAAINWGSWSVILPDWFFDLRVNTLISIS